MKSNRLKTRAGSLPIGSCWRSVKRIAVLGEAMFEQRHEVTPLATASSSAQREGLIYGGDAINFAVYLNRLVGDEVSVSFVSALGADARSAQMLEEWQREGLVCQQLAIDPHRATGSYQIQLDEQGERSFSYQRTGSAASVYLAQLPDGWSSRFDAIYLTGITLAILDDVGRERVIEELTQFADEGGCVVFDSNYRPALWPSQSVAKREIARVKQLARLNLLTLDDEAQLFDDEYLPNSACLKREGVLKRGAQPALVYSQQEVVAVPVPSPQTAVRVVDTTAAGDAFNAGYLASRLLGEEPKQAAHHGHSMAASVITQFGAIIPLSAMPSLYFNRANAS